MQMHSTPHAVVTQPWQEARADRGAARTGLRAFLGVLFAGATGVMELRALPSARRAFVPLRAYRDVKRFIAQCGTDNLYVGVAARKDATSGTLENCSTLGAVFADIDFKTTTPAEARQRLDGFPIRPSMELETGGGLHAHWLLQQPVDVQQERDRIYRALRGLARAVGGDPAAAEPARILRVPGTLNRKYTPARPVRVVAFHPERRYHLGDFALPDEPQNEGRWPRFTMPPVVYQGDRNHQMYRKLRSLLARNKGDLTREELLDHATILNLRRCRPPMSEREITMLVTGAWSRRDSPDFARNGQPDRDGDDAWQPLIVPLSTVEPQDVEWLWRHRIAIGKLNLLVGDPDVGKSYLTCDIASRVSTGRIWPDGTDCPHGYVILLAAEDALGDTTRPRIDRLGGDPNRIFALTMMRKGTQERMLSLVDDLDALEHEIEARHALLVVIDVLNAYLGTAKRPIDSYRDSDIRGVLAPLAKMAERQRVTLLATMHLTKNTERRALYRVLGSIGYVGQARMVLSASFDPRDSDHQRRLLAGMKGNIARKAPTLAFSITDAGLLWEPDPVQGISAEQALGDLSPDEHSARQTAREFLRARLHAGTEVEVNVVGDEAKPQGISMRSLQRARKDIGARARHDGRSGKWYWGPGQMPPDDGTVASCLYLDGRKCQYDGGFWATCQLANWPAPGARGHAAPGIAPAV